ncbi:probable glutamate receptor isoform X2 [Cephus cinctus]|uniref:Probable glutamate receptor isoform X2 n=1 Tax=Cephus cinctus TaxID=211228 RepID=A0AAJ7FHT0_CEPCN|nr:probable glutamate receptor isoform X2 [Cephus cinctus]
MDLRFLLFVFVCAIRCNDANGLSAQFLQDYFADKFIHQIVVFACYNHLERVSLSRQLMLSDTKLSYISISENINMKTTLAVNYYKLGIVLDLDCTKSEIVLDKFQKERLPYNESYFWMVISKDSMPPIEILRKLPLTVETEFTLALHHDEIYVLYDVYNPSYRHGGRLNVTYMGVWNPLDGLSIKLTQYKYKRRADFQGLHLNFSIALSNPPLPDLMTYISNPINRHLDTMHRFNYALLLQLRDYYNYTMILTQSETWGYLINGSFNGLLGDMIKGLVDVGVTPLQFKRERIDVAEFTVQTYLARPSFFLRHPKKTSVRNGFLKPFREEVWWIVVAVGFIYWLILWLTSKLELYYRNRMPFSKINLEVGFETGFICMAAISQQGLTDSPRLYSGRIVFLSLFVWALLLYQFYSASIVGSLLAEPPRYINDLKDLLESNLEIGIDDIAYNYDFFATTSDPVALELYKRKVAPNKYRKKPAFYNHTEGLRKVKKGGFAFHADVNTAYKIITLFPAKHVATVTSKHSPFKKMVTYGMRQIMEHGLSERLMHVWQYRRPICPKTHSSTPVPVALGEFLPATLLLLMGLIIAVAVLSVENFCKRCKYPEQLSCNTYVIPGFKNQADINMYIQGHS